LAASLTPLIRDFAAGKVRFRRTSPRSGPVYPGRPVASPNSSASGHQQTHALQQKRPRGPFRQLAKLM
jgi:hypothetical protein